VAITAHSRNCLSRLWRRRLANNRFVENGSQVLEHGLCYIREMRRRPQFARTPRGERHNSSQQPATWISPYNHN
jgi:hypothetical protein